MSRIIREYVLPCYEEAGLLWVQGVHGKVGENQEVVRCRECEHADESEIGTLRCHGPLVNPWDYYLDEPSLGKEVEPDGYCAWGERREP